MVGSAHAVETMLGFSPTDPERLLQALRLFIDGRKRSLAEASLGSANLLYLTLKLLELEQLAEQRNRDHTFFAIEEPEAHLHPHLQRLVFRDVLGPRIHQVDSEGTHRADFPVTILLTTHSPHIVSVAPIKSIVILRKSPDLNSTEGVSTACLKLNRGDVEDLERYLDVTRGEILFAKGVLLVEGDAELFLIPKLGKLIGIDFDELGISVCSVSGTNFPPYVKLLGKGGMDVPFAVLTDRDPRNQGMGRGERRIKNLLSIVAPPGDLEGKTDGELINLSPEYGLFIGQHTFEVDLFRCGLHDSMGKTLVRLAKGNTAKERAKKWMESPSGLDAERFLKDIDAIGKGRFAQRLASRLMGTSCPTYVKNAIKYVASRCKQR